MNFKNILASFIVSNCVFILITAELNTFRAERGHHGRNRNQRKSFVHGKYLFRVLGRNGCSYNAFKMRQQATNLAERKENHHGRHEVKLQKEENEYIDLIKQYHVAMDRGVYDHNIYVSREARDFMRKYGVGIPGIHGGRYKRFMARSNDLRWDKCIIPYRFNFTTIDRATGVSGKIRAMNRIQYWTGFRFVNWSPDVPSVYALNHDNHLIHIVGQGCWSFIGNIKANRGQEIACCDDDQCVHELGHVVGLYHEHQSALRSDYVRVNYDKIRDAFEQQFYMLDPSVAMLFGYYDISSIMHYSLYGFQDQGLKTLTIEDPKQEYLVINKDDQMYYMFYEMERSHQCNKYFCSNFDKKCENDGYLTVVKGKCRCRCPEGLDHVTGCTTIYQGDEDAVNAIWPEGNFTILKPTTGCPLGFNEGSVTQYAKLIDKSVPVHHDVLTNGQTITQEFCTKTHDKNQKYTAWENGQYCILRQGGRCPVGFVDGFVRFDNTYPSNTHGTVPDGVYKDNTLLYFCCKEDGSHKDPITLPFSKPFILFQRSNEGCQAVTDMYAESEYITIQNDKTGFNKLSGLTPHIRFLNKTNSYEIYFCYYFPIRYGCGEFINLSEDNPTAVIRSPNFPNNYNNGQTCYWMIKGPEHSRIELNMNSFDVEETKDGTCSDYLDIRCYLIGQPGIAFCGQDFKESIISQTNLLGLIFGTDLYNTRKGFEATLTLLTDDSLCYLASDKGQSYRGTVSYTRSYEKCVPWSKVKHCRHNMFDVSDLDDDLEGNYCRNPGDGSRPWCYTSEYQCIRNYCDVCKLELCYDVFDDCDELIAEDRQFCQKDENAFRGCHKTCGLCEDIRKKETKHACPPPDDLPDADLMEENKPKRNQYKVGEQVKYKCRTGKETTTLTCLSDGTWSWAGFACGVCPTGWLPFKDSCYKWFDDYKLKNESIAECKRHNAVIASAKNQDESNFLLKIRGEDRKYWIGVVYVKELGHFWEEDGSEAKWTNWWYGETDGCAYVTTSGRWIGVKCDDYLYLSVMCKLTPSKRQVCMDRRQDCVKVAEESPSVCVDNPEFKRQACSVTCGYCAPGFGQISTCKNPNSSGNFDLETGGAEIKTGNVFVYVCKTGFVHTVGNLVRMCLPTGELTGSPPVCRSMADVPVPVNTQSMVQRRNVGTEKKAYFSFNSLHTIPKDGYLIKWEFYSGYDGHIVLQVWRRTKIPNSFLLVGQHHVKKTRNARKRTITLNRRDRIKVQKGDAIGLFYPKRKGVNPGGIQYDECSARINGPYGSHYESVNTFGRPNGYKKRRTYAFTNVREMKTCRIYSLNAIVL